MFRYWSIGAEPCYSKQFISKVYTSCKLPFCLREFKDNVFNNHIRRLQVIVPTLRQMLINSFYSFLQKYDLVTGKTRVIEVASTFARVRQGKESATFLPKLEEKKWDTRLSNLQYGKRSCWHTGKFPQQVIVDR